jgi:hypothetical protein
MIPIQFHPLPILTTSLCNIHLNVMLSISSVIQMTTFPEVSPPKFNRPHLSYMSKPLQAPTWHNPNKQWATCMTHEAFHYINMLDGPCTFWSPNSAFRLAPPASWSVGSSVSIVTRLWVDGWGIRVWFLVRAKDFSLLHGTQTSSGAYSSSCPTSTEDFFPGG